MWVWVGPPAHWLRHNSNTEGGEPWGCSIGTGGWVGKVGCWAYWVGPVLSFLSAPSPPSSPPSVSSHRPPRLSPLIIPTHPTYHLLARSGNLDKAVAVHLFMVTKGTKHGLCTLSKVEKGASPSWVSQWHSRNPGHPIVQCNIIFRPDRVLS